MMRMTLKRRGTKRPLTLTTPIFRIQFSLSAPQLTDDTVVRSLGPVVLTSVSMEILTNVHSLSSHVTYNGPITGLQGNPPHFIWTDLLVKCKETSITYYLRENVGVTHRTLFEWSCCGASNAGSSHSQTRHCLQLASSARERGLKDWWLRLHLIDQSSNYNS